MNAVACLRIAQLGLTLSEVLFVGHLVDCHGEWKIEDHLAPSLNGNGSNGTAPLARLMGKLGCQRSGDLEAVLKRLAESDAGVHVKRPQD